MSQMCDRGNQALFTFDACTITNHNSGNLVHKRKKHKIFYKADNISSPENKLTWLSAIDIDSLLSQKRLGHASFSLLNKLITKDMYLYLPKPIFKNDKVYDACAKGKHVKFSFKSKKVMRTS